MWKGWREEWKKRRGDEGRIGGKDNGFRLGSL
jgi:hypothetical protein